MTPKRPDVLVLGDNARRTMWRRGHVHGFNAAYSIWVFGFLPGTEPASRYGLSIARPEFGYLWVMARHNGEIVTKARAIGARHLPPIMRHVLSSSFSQLPNLKFPFS